MKAPQYHSNKEDSFGEKVVVEYNDDRNIASNPSSLIETIPEHNYLTRKKVRYKTRKNSKTPYRRSSLSSSTSDASKMQNGDILELENQGK